MIDFILFGLPLIPLVWASIQDIRSKNGEFDEVAIYAVLCAAVFWKLMAYPDTIFTSIAFGAFATFIGALLCMANSWQDGDTMMFGAVGFAIPAVDVVSLLFALLISMIPMGAAMAFLGRRKVNKKRKEKLKHGLWVLVITYILYWFMIGGFT